MSTPATSVTLDRSVISGRISGITPHTWTVNAAGVQTTTANQALFMQHTNASKFTVSSQTALAGLTLDRRRCRAGAGGSD